MKNYTVLIAGGSGLIGQNLKHHLEKLDVTVRILSRKKILSFFGIQNKNKLMKKHLTK